MSWIVIPNWERFQHYKDRNPAWIKVYTNLLHHEAFLSLAQRQKGLLFDIWMLYAVHDGQLPASPAYIANQCGFPSEWVVRQRREAGEWDGEDTVRDRDLKALEKAEFIEIVASKPLALARARVRDRDRTPTPKRGKGKRAVEGPRVTGWRQVRGTHAITHIPDPFGTDVPPADAKGLHA